MADSPLRRRCLAGGGGSIMTRKQILARRRAINAELARIDASNRCAQCQAPLRGKRLTTLTASYAFCCEDCLADYLAGFPQSGHA